MFLLCPNSGVIHTHLSIFLQVPMHLVSCGRDLIEMDFFFQFTNISILRYVNFSIFLLFVTEFEFRVAFICHFVLLWICHVLEWRKVPRCGRQVSWLPEICESLSSIIIWCLFSNWMLYKPDPRTQHLQNVKEM